MVHQPLQIVHLPDQKDLLLMEDNIHLRMLDGTRRILKLKILRLMLQSSQQVLECEEYCLYEFYINTPLYSKFLAIHRTFGQVQFTYHHSFQLSLCYHHLGD
jgi:hypothetical protein